MILWVCDFCGAKSERQMHAMHVWADGTRPAGGSRGTSRRGDLCDACYNALTQTFRVRGDARRGRHIAPCYICGQSGLIAVQLNARGDLSRYTHHGRMCQFHGAVFVERTQQRAFNHSQAATKRSRVVGNLPPGASVASSQ